MSFAFRHLPVTSEPDITANFEQLQTAWGELPTGPAGGSLTGTYPNPTIAALAVSEAMLAAAVVAKLNPGAWTILEEINGNVVATGSEPLGVRTEQGKTVARLRGILEIKAATEIKSGETIAKLPAGFRPAKEVKMPIVTTLGYGIISVPATGVMTCSINLTAGSFFGFDGVTFNLT